MSSTVTKRVLREPDRTHAVLFVGHEGSGVLRQAREVAKGWLCTGAEPPCDACPSCRSFDAGTCVDFQAIEPTGASRNILLKVIVPVENEEPPATIPLSLFFRTSPLMAKRKVVLIQNADRLNERASSALLKMLEEPPSFGKFILTTGSVSRMPSTILSRCTSIVCSMPSTEELSEEFGELSGAESLFGEGAPERLRLVRENSALFEDMSLAFSQFNSEPIGAALRIAEQLRSLGEALGEKLGSGNRQGNAEVLRALGRWWITNGVPHPEALACIAESHRAILGNGGAPAIFDALVTRLMLCREPMEAARP
ncbi:MAG: hypothetical protein JNK63_05680 [Chthonomonas sp.]|nr:hypothetical protein [Chthonomonas sp.]